MKIAIPGCRFTFWVGGMEKHTTEPATNLGVSASATIGVQYFMHTIAATSKMCKSSPCKPCRHP